MRYWEDFQPGEVETFGNYHLQASEVADFAQRFGAATSNASSAAAQTAPQMLICGVYMRLLVDHLLAHSTSMGSPGIDSIDWLQPVHAGDVLSVRLQLLSARALESRADMGLLKHRATVSNQHDAVVLELVSNALFRRRAAA